MTEKMKLTNDQQRDFEAAAFRTLLAHLDKRSDVQNIDMMNLAGFCRNCLANWYRDAANEAGLAMTKDESRQIIYGEPYEDWRERNQKPADAAKLAAFAVNRPKEA